MKKLEMNRCVYPKGPGSLDSQCREPLSRSIDRFMIESMRNPGPLTFSANVPDDVSKLMRAMDRNRRGRENQAENPRIESVEIRCKGFGFRFTGLTPAGIELVSKLAPNKWHHTGSGKNCTNPESSHVEKSLLLAGAIRSGSQMLYDAVSNSSKPFVIIQGEIESIREAKKE